MRSRGSSRMISDEESKTCLLLPKSVSSHPLAQVAELADALGSGPSDRNGRGGSSPLLGTFGSKDLRRLDVSPFFLRLLNTWQCAICVDCQAEIPVQTSGKEYQDGVART